MALETNIRDGIVRKPSGPVGRGRNIYLTAYVINVHTHAPVRYECRFKNNINCPPIDGGLVVQLKLSEWFIESYKG